MDARLTSYGYEFLPSKYTPPLGYSGLHVLISGQPTQRFFDAKLLTVPTFDGRFFRHTNLSRHELELYQTFQVCLGELKMETHRGDKIQAFTFGGVLHAHLQMGELYCELNSSAPIFKLQEEAGSVSRVVVDEVMELVAQDEVKLSGHEDELYSRLSKSEPYPLFLACLVSIQQRAESIPAALRRSNYQKISSRIKQAVQIVRETDGWDGRSPSLEDLLFNGGAG
jgi:hypothetical protein